MSWLNPTNFFYFFFLSKTSISYLPADGSGVGVFEHSLREKKKKKKGSLL